MSLETRQADDKLIRIFSRMFGLEATDVSDEASVHTIEGWDSLKHINLMLAIEEEFGVSLTPEEVETMISVGLIKDVLKGHGVLVK